MLTPYSVTLYWFNRTFMFVEIAKVANIYCRSKTKVK